MTARARVLFVRPDVNVLVIDRLPNITRDQAEAIIKGAAAGGAFAGVIVFPFDVDLPDADPEPVGIRLCADEADAISRLTAVVAGVHGAELRQSDRDLLYVLVNRFRQWQAQA